MRGRSFAQAAPARRRRRAASIGGARGPARSCADPAATISVRSDCRRVRQARRAGLQLVGIVDEGEGSPVERDEGSSVHAVGSASPRCPVHAARRGRAPSPRPPGWCRGRAPRPPSWRSPSSRSRPRRLPASSADTKATLAAAGRLEALLDDLAGPVFPDEGRVGVDRQDGLGLAAAPPAEISARTTLTAMMNGICLLRRCEPAGRRRATRRAIARAASILNPSAGMILFRFDGLAARLSAPRSTP